MSYRENIRRARSQRAQGSAARNIHEGLEDILLAGGDRAPRRWCWELLQNARDVGRPGGARVRFTLTEGPNPSLTFSHDGAPFTSDDLVNLVEKDSTKRRPHRTGRPQSLGRFGTGFLTTHLLARRVEVSGFVQDPGEPVKAIVVPLDRSGDDVEALRAGVEASFAALDGIESTPPAESYTPDAYNTRFTYHLDDRGPDVARVGFEDLERLLPLTLVFVDGIASVEIEHTGTTYSVGSRTGLGDGLDRVSIQIVSRGSRTTREFIAVREADTVLAVPVTVESEGLTLRPLEPEVPRLFCGFPLVGSEGFPLPVAVSSHEFHPTEKRDGAVLGDADHYKPKDNRSRFESEVVSAYERLLRAAGDWRDAYVLAALRSGDTYDWLDSNWFSERVLAPLREKALTAPLVEMARGGRSSIVGSQLEPLVRFPTGSSRDLQEALWDVAEPLAGDRLPIRDHVSVWRGQLWTDEFDLTPAHLVLMAARGDLSALVDTMGVGVDEALAWLGRFVALLRESGYARYLDPFKATIWATQIFSPSSRPNSRTKQSWTIADKPVLPNQHGVFCHARDLTVDVDLDETLKDVAASLGDDVRTFLLSEGVDVHDPSHKSMASQELAARVEKTVYKKVHDGDDGVATRSAFAGLLKWFDENPDEAERLFARLYYEQHLLQTAEEARVLRQKAGRVDALEEERDDLSKTNAALRKEVAELREQLSEQPQSPETSSDEALEQARHYAETWIEIKQALGLLGTAEAAITARDLERLLETQPGAFQHISKALREAYVTFRHKLERAKARVREELDHNPLYDTSGWREVPDFPTIIEGVRRRAVRAEGWHPPHPITLVIRPADGGFVVLYDPEERAVLGMSDAELWIEGDGEGPERLTLGGLAERLRVNRIPLRAPVGKPAVLHLS